MKKAKRKVMGCWFKHKFLETKINKGKGTMWLESVKVRPTDFCIKCGLTKKELGIENE